MTAGRRRLATDEVILTRHGWEATRIALSRLKDVASELAADLAAGRDPGSDYVRSVASLSAAIAELQEASEAASGLVGEIRGIRLRVFVHLAHVRHICPIIHVM